MYIHEYYNKSHYLELHLELSQAATMTTLSER